METRTVSPNVVRADEVIGVNVINRAKEDLGKIYQLVLDKFTGQTLYVVLESGSFLGMGGKLFALPWKALHFDPNEEAFILDISKDTLKNAPGFDKNNWPDMADRAWSMNIFSFYGIKPGIKSDFE